LTLLPPLALLRLLMLLPPLTLLPPVFRVLDPPLAEVPPRPPVLVRIKVFPPLP
jgi:hypothetical protein